MVKNMERIGGTIAIFNLILTPFPQTQSSMIDLTLGWQSAIFIFSNSNN